MAGHDRVHGLYGDNHTPANKLDATVAPDADNDVTEGYGVGSWWFDITAGKAYTCLDATEGAAVWVEATAGDVSADANLTDDMIVRGKGGAKGVQTSLIELLDAGMMRVPIGQGVAAKTDDASDDAYTNFCGGGAEGDDRGAYVACFGNEHASGAGKLLLWAGNVVGGNIQMYTENEVRLQINKDGTITIAGITTLADGSKLATNAAPVADVDLVNKKALDDAIAGGGITGNDYICLQDQKAQNTNGGTFTQGAWRTRDLNVEQSDDGAHCALNANQFTLDAGDYVILSYAPTHAVKEHQSILYNVTGSVTLITGLSSYDQDNMWTTGRSFIFGKFTIAAGQALEIRHRCSITRADIGLGRPANLTTEIYTSVQLWKVG